MKIRPIEQRDNPRIAAIIREVLTEFGANRPGFAWQDPELDAMCESYSCPGRAYYVVDIGSVVDKGSVVDGEDVEKTSINGIVGGAGIAEFQCEKARCCELQKMYLISEAREQGTGASLIDLLLDEARLLGYKYCYLETLSSMHGARALYRKKGFELLDRPLGESGHSACDEWYLKTL